MYLRKAIVVGAGLLITGSSWAGEYCVERIKSVIVHADGVRFTSDKTCTLYWCKIDWTDAQSKNALALLLTAKTTDSEVRIYWPAAPTACAPNANLASPDSLQML